MNNIIKLKSLVSIILSIFIMCAFLSLSAAAPTPSIPPADHKQTIQQFISEIREVQNQVFDIAQFSLNNQPLNQEGLASNISRINNTIDRLNKRISEYSETVPSMSTQNGDVLLISNALNLVENGLYTLNLLTAATTDVQRITLLDEYFRSRIAAKDTLNTVEELISQN